MLQMDHFCSITSGMKLEKSNTGIAINVLLNSKKGIYTALGSEFNRTGGKQVNLSMIMDGEKDSTQQ